MDYITLEERRIVDPHNLSITDRQNYYIKAKSTGEFRVPEKGEWYVSGAIPEVYRAVNDFPLGMSFAIAKLVLIERTVTWTEVRSI